MAALIRFAFAAATTAVLATPTWAQAPELPTRRAGQWEVTTVAEKPIAAKPVVTQMCLDAATDRELMSFGLRMSKETCKRYDVKRAGKGWSIDAECSFGRMTNVSHTTISGDFQSAVTVRVEGTMDGLKAGAAGGEPQPTLVTQTSRWVSATCANGMVPGDISMGKGIRLNIKQLKGLQNILPQIQIR